MSLADVLGVISGGMGALGTALQRRQDKNASAYEKARAKAALADIEREQGFRKLEDPREQAMLRQSMFGRGLGKSSIATQEGARLTDIQARRNAALASQRELARSGLSLIRKQRKFARRIQWLPVLAQATGGAAAGASFVESLNQKTET